MTINFTSKSASYDVTSLYCLIGEAICMIQHLEGALSVLITLKKDVKYPHRISKEEAKVFLEKCRLLTLGKAINLAKKTNLFSVTLCSSLEEILKERNWLVHKFLHDYLDNAHITSTIDGFVNKIKTISDEAKRLQEAIEADLIAFSESTGIDMSRVRAYIKHYSREPDRMLSSL